MKIFKSSRIKKRITVPNVFQMSRADALSLLNTLGFRVKENTVTTSDESQGGKISSQSLTSGSTYLAGEEIEYSYGVFSFAPFGFTPFSFTPTNNASVPNVSGMTEQQAYAAITDAGYTYNYLVPIQTNDPSLAGTVVDAWRPEGSTEVTLNVYTYVPDAGPFSFTPFGFSPVDPAPFTFTPSPDPGPYNFITYNFTPYNFTAIYGAKSIGADTLIKSKNPDGLLLAWNLRVGDVLCSANIEGIDTSNDQIANYIHNWSAQNANIDTGAETTIVAMAARIVDGAIIINGNKYSKAHWILVKESESGVIKFKNVPEVSETDQIFSPETMSWDLVTSFMEIDSRELVISINVEPYDVFFTDNALVHDSYNASQDPNAINSSQEDFGDKILEIYAEWQNSIQQ
jgi:hypothetical protein